MRPSAPLIGLMVYDKNTGFSATPLLNTLRKDHPRSLRALAVVQGGRGHWAPWASSCEVIRTGKPQANATLGSSMWEYYATPAGAEEAVAFSQAVGVPTGAFMLEAAPLIDTRSVGFRRRRWGARGSLRSQLRTDKQIRKTELAADAAIEKLAKIPTARRALISITAWFAAIEKIVCFAAPRSI